MIKNLVISAFMAVICLALVVPEAEAARFGGGRSFGMRRAAPPARPPSLAGKPAPAAAGAAAAKPGAGRFLGPLAGLAAGIGLVALLSHFGIGEGMANILLIMALVMGAMFVLRWLARKSAPPADARFAGAGPANFNPAPAQFEAQNLGAGGTAMNAAAVNIPADFDAEGFLRQAKVNFVRLQAANDRGDMDDIREFTTPEVFAEVQLEYKERGDRSQETDVVQLNAELLEVVTEEYRHVVSVRFTGLIREDANAEPAEFSEIWHLTKPIDDSRGWNVAGIQQA